MLDWIGVHLDVNRTRRPRRGIRPWPTPIEFKLRQRFCDVSPILCAEQRRPVAGEGPSSRPFFSDGALQAEQCSRSPEMDRAAAAVAEQTWISDVARLCRYFQKLDRGVAEPDLASWRRSSGAPSNRSSAGCKDLHARPTAAGGAFTTHRKADRLGEPIRASFGVRQRPRTGHHGMPSLLAFFLASILSPIRRRCSALRAMKCRLWSARISRRRAFSRGNRSREGQVGRPLSRRADSAPAR